MVGCLAQHCASPAGGCALNESLIIDIIGLLQDQTTLLLTRSLALDLDQDDTLSEAV